MIIVIISINILNFHYKRVYNFSKRYFVCLLVFDKAITNMLINSVRKKNVTGLITTSYVFSVVTYKHITEEYVIFRKCNSYRVALCEPETERGKFTLGRAARAHYPRRAAPCAQYKRTRRLFIVCSNIKYMSLYIYMCLCT